MTRVNETTSIPLIWVLCAYVPTTTLVLAAAWWVFGVDSHMQRFDGRLDRIEKRLGIGSTAPSGEFSNARHFIITPAEAHQ